MLEICVDVASGGEMFADARDHRRSLFGGVFGLAITIVGVIGGYYVWGSSLLSLGYTEGDVALAQSIPSGIAVPGFVAELEGRPHSSGQALQKFGEHGLVCFEIRRQLKEQRAEASGALQGF